jgi:predicted GNAT family acetyltransferase
MIVTTHRDAAQFLSHARDALLANEAANNLMLGLAFRLERYPERAKTPPYFATVADRGDLVLACVMTPPHNLLVYGARDDLRRALDLVAQDLRVHQWSVPGVLGPADAAVAFAETWIRLFGGRYEIGFRQRIYELRRVIPPPAPPGAFRTATQRDVDLITQWMLGFQSDIWGTDGEEAEARESAERRVGDRQLYLWEDGQPVSLAGRSRPTVNGITVNMVYTPPEHRRRGYATACVAHTSQLCLDEGWQFCTLFADLANPTSNHIYQSIGYVPVCDFDEYVFAAEDTEP